VTGRACGLHACSLRNRLNATPHVARSVLQAELAKGAILELGDAMAEEVQPSLKWFAELDVTISLAEVSEQNSFTRPVLTEANVLHIDKGVFAHTWLACTLRLGR
jgi:hypothetical protein